MMPNGPKFWRLSAHFNQKQGNFANYSVHHTKSPQSLHTTTTPPFLTMSYFQMPKKRYHVDSEDHRPRRTSDQKWKESSRPILWPSQPETANAVSGLS
ncbi:hypothetical protein GJ744_000339 [Endocarpon pusillum]|uniref:Uncharacterized protein n=1 Tax=Endocarpon pusillum TaxID=364733 RepID=A0A8H7E857_9EURO|nr:hypothetical protein GJ744_000339 [Endocarpon pusillum]